MYSTESFKELSALEIEFIFYIVLADMYFYFSRILAKISTEFCSGLQHIGSNFVHAKQIIETERVFYIVQLLF